ncbi:MAG: UTP--glucose-1-phosphate uridylyltransferase [Alphaproteobacteria bacterium]|jgi:UTP--glucose-1-phosphate uridylyltransferase|nr:UTP--glucose-1-phosphate uridylyltransferase [Alphaproteobacteria bacterium]
MKPKIKKAVFPVAGLGTRFLPATKVVPKEMMPVFNKPIVQYAVEEAMSAGIEEFIFVTGRGKVIIEDHFDVSYELENHLVNNNKNHYKELISQGIPKPGKAFFTRQQYPMGLGHAIWCAKALINNEPFAVLLPDEYLKSSPTCLANMVDIYNKSADIDMMLAYQEVAWANVSSYGVLNTGNKHSQHSLVPVNSVVEKPKAEDAPSNYAIIGRYILQPTIFEHLEKAQKGVGGEIQLTDSIDKIIAQHKTVGYEYTGERFDCGNPLGLLEASIEVGLDTAEYGEKIKEILKRRLGS